MGGFSHERHPPRYGCVICTLLLVSLCGRLGAQSVPSAGSSSNTTSSVPDYVPPDRAPQATNGAPESSNAPPQLRQTIEDQSDDQSNPAFISKHMIADRFWISGQANFIFQTHA